ncbi:hypothetical protein [Stutzerimonas stutzeri]|uniref:Uncharacterized protein n=1 Tax=Stutzerimonas stutzeri TaxID=316 RepID=A0A172WT69_STUST|nr:hypothetical protein [Stutzerimonas stutzeri]ANF26643.1 hypothetical protein PS273GM_16530 [Stutzerimonas stutzeri]
MKRRTLLISSAATLGLVAIGSGTWVYEDRQVFIPQLLQRLVGNFQMDPDDQRKFVDAMADHYGSEKLIALMGLYKIRQETGVGTAYTDLRVDNFERRLLTDFMVSTDFLRQQNKTNPKVSFLGYRLPCSNPYARFDGLA